MFVDPLIFFESVHMREGVMVEKFGMTELLGIRGFNDNLLRVSMGIDRVRTWFVLVSPMLRNASYQVSG